MDKIQKREQGLARTISSDLLRISPNDFHLSVQEKIDQARKDSETAEEYENKLVVISQQTALARADIDDEWISRCKTPKNTKKELAKCTTLTHAIDLLAPSLYKIKGIKGDEHILSWISLWIVDLQVNLNIKNKMTEDMIHSCSEAILDAYGYLTIPDVKNVFSDALSGVYGEFYESLSIPKVLKWFDEYGERRMNEYDARNYSDHSYRKNSMSGFQYPEDAERKRSKPKMVRREELLTEDDMLEIERGKDGLS